MQAPMDFVTPNLVGFAHVLDACHRLQVPRLLYASSSSVYGMRSQVPFLETDRTDQPQSFYAATKMANEMMAYAYHSQYGMASLGMRFFTVYGPWGRTDMAPFMFAQNIRRGLPIKVFGEGKLRRDLETYYLKSGAGSPWRLTVPRGAYRPELQHAPHHNGSGPLPAADGTLPADPRAELRRVLDSPDFPATPRNRRFLEFAAEKVLAGHEGKIDPYDIGTEVFGRPESFNPLTDPIVRIEAGKLRRDLETYYLKSGRANPLRLTLPKGGYRPEFVPA